MLYLWLQIVIYRLTSNIICKLVTKYYSHLVIV